VTLQVPTDELHVHVRTLRAAAPDGPLDHNIRGAALLALIRSLR